MHNYKLSFLLNSLRVLSLVSCSNTKVVGSINRELGNILRKQGAWKEAFEYFDKALSIYETQCPISSEMSKLLVAIANLAWEKNRLNEAYEYYTKAHSIDVKLGNKEDVARDLNNLALIKKEQDEYQESYKLFQKAKTMYEDLNKPHSDKIAVIHINLSGVLINLKRIDEAFDYATSGLNVFINYYSDDLVNIAMSYNAVGICYYEKGNLDKALEYHNEGLKIFKELYREEHVSIANCYFLIGKATINRDLSRKYCVGAKNIILSIANNNSCDMSKDIEIIDEFLKTLTGD